MFFLVLILKVIGTHNSYHRRTSIPTIGDMFAYDFPSIAGQLDAGVRHLELDVHYDWKTGRLYMRMLCTWSERDSIARLHSSSAKGVSLHKTAVVCSAGFRLLSCFFFNYYLVGA